MEQGKTRKTNGKRVEVDPSEWVIVPNTHEGIISREVFERVRAIRERIHREALAIKITPYSQNVFLGKIFCGVCGHPMRRKRQNKDGTYWFRCDSQWKYREDICTVVSARETELAESILLTLYKQVEVITGEYIKIRERGGSEEELAKELARINQTLAKDGKILRSLYESMVSEIITKDEFTQMKADNETKIAGLSKRADEIRRKQRQSENNIREEQEVMEIVRKTMQSKKLTAEIISRLIEKILVFPNWKFEVHYKFRDEFTASESVCREVLNVG